MSAFLIVSPYTIDDAAFVASNVTEADYPVWLVGSSFELGDRCIVVDTDTHYIYESVNAATNTGHDPADDEQAPTGVPVWWVLVGKTNRWKMFDNKNSSQTVNADLIAVELLITRRPNAVALLNVEATSIQVIQKDGMGIEVFNETYSMIETSGEPGFYNWFFQQIRRKTDIYIDGLKPISSGTILVNLFNAGTNAKCGTCIVGYSEQYGETQLGAEVGIIDFSVKKQNEFGDYEVLERAFSREGRFQIFLENGLVDRLQALLASRRALSTLYIASTDFKSTHIFGFYTDMRNVIQYNEHSLFSIDVTSLS